jgi:hypothetical protein
MATLVGRLRTKQKMGHQQKVIDQVAAVMEAVDPVEAVDQKEDAKTKCTGRSTYFQLAFLL